MPSRKALLAASLATATVISLSPRAAHADPTPTAAPAQTAPTPYTPGAAPPSATPYGTYPAQAAPQQAAPTQGYGPPGSTQSPVVYAPQPTGYVGPVEISSYEEGAPIPNGYHPESRTRTGLIVAGSVTFGTMYLITALVAAGNADAHEHGSNPAAALWIPAVGPFIQMTNTDSSVAGVFLAIDGITQVAGLTMLVVGLTSPKTVLVRNDFGKVQVRPVPVVTGNTMGAGLAGTF